MTGAPAFGTTPGRRATSDWSNRRKELKFAATDLKLYRRQQETQIDHWDSWRRKQPPKTYFLWCARMTPKDNLAMMVDEVRAIVDTYLDGAGLFAYRENAAGTAYQAVQMLWRARVAHLDDVLHRIANEINDLASPEGAVPPPRIPDRRAVDAQALADDVQS